MTDRADTPVLRPADLTTLERTYLGVLDAGMVPAQLAGDQTLRTDYVVAVCFALREGMPESTYLESGSAEPSFVADLIAAARALDEKGVISFAPPATDILLTPEGQRPSPPAEIDLEQRPRIRDRYLAHACLEELFGDGRVYPFLMGKYQDSGEVWARLYRERPERFL